MRQLLLSAFYLPLSLISPPTTTTRHCKTSPQNQTWPSNEEWHALNESIGGTLLRTAPAASSCYDGNPLNSPYDCASVKKGWKFGAYHASWPESIDHPIFTNNSCIPPGADGYDEKRGCSIGALPQYIVNATTEEQVAMAMEWASKRDARIVVKSTGHDFNGRSTGAYALSIWTHNFNHIKHDSKWRIPGSKDTADVLICGGGVVWASAYIAANEVNRTVVGAEDVTVGLAGSLQNGGHGLLSSHNGLGSDNLYQATVITSQGRRLVVNDEQNQDLFWAIRGAGGGQFGVVTEFVLGTNPVPENLVYGRMTFHARDMSDAAENASWAALAELSSQFPDLIDSGITGTVDCMTGDMAVKYMRLPHAVSGTAATVNFVRFNSTTRRMNETIHKMINRIRDVSHGNLNLTYARPSSHSFWSFTKPHFLSSTFSGSSRVFTGRLLGRPALSDLPKKDLIHYLRKVSVAQDAKEGTLLRFDLHAGPGPARTPEKRRGSVIHAWRTTYTLVMAWGAKIDATEDPSKALTAGAEWYEKVKEPVWREWAPKSGAYMNSANGFSRSWKRDFYGDNYERLLEIKRKYDPTESLFVYSGVGSDRWEYDLHSGLLCRADS